MVLCFYTVWEIIWRDFLVWYCFLFESLIRAGSVFFCFVLFSFWLSPEALGILVPQLGIKPMPPAVDTQRPSQWTVRDPDLFWLKEGCGKPQRTPHLVNSFGHSLFIFVIFKKYVFGSTRS